jgi:hypothetical protein
MTSRRFVKPCEDCRTGFLGRAETRFCRDCRFKVGNRPTSPRQKYPVTEETDAYIRAHYVPHTRNGLVARIARHLKWSEDAVYKRAAALGLTQGRPEPWTPEEVAFVEQHAGKRLPSWIEAQMKSKARRRVAGFIVTRSASSITQKINKLGLTRAVKNGTYSATELGQAFGRSGKVVELWISRGWLRATRSEQGHGPHTPWSISEEAVVEFILAHPRAFILREIDQTWFLDLLRTHTRPGWRKGLHLAPPVVQLAERESEDAWAS